MGYQKRIRVETRNQTLVMLYAVDKTLTGQSVDNLRMPSTELNNIIKIPI